MTIAKTFVAVIRRHSRSSLNFTENHTLNGCLSTDAGITHDILLVQRQLLCLALLRCQDSYSIYIFPQTWCQIRELMCRYSTPPTSFQPCARTLYQSSGSVTFLHESGSCYFHHWPSRCDANRKLIFLKVFLLITFWTYIYIIIQR